MEVSVNQTLEAFFTSRKFAFREFAFRNLSEYLLKLNRPVMIVETGCMRPPRVEGSEWEDGQSTMVWDCVAQLTGGKCYSIELNAANVKYAQERVSASTEIIEGDSISVLSRAKFEPHIDLLYLDSMDFTDGMEMESCLHHGGEMAAAWSQVKSGGIIAVDDCAAPFRGKHAWVKCFFEVLGNVGPSGMGYVCWWRKP